MTRPNDEHTRRDADEALEIAAEWLRDGTIVWHDPEAILAAEVRALRDELRDEQHAQHAIMLNQSATIARVEAALNEARNTGCDFVAIDHVRKALRGEP